MEEIYPRNLLLQTRVGPFKCGLVDNINSAMENMFILLGQRSSNHKVTVTMQLDDIYPGAGAKRMPYD